MTDPPEHVRAAFGLTRSDGVPLGAFGRVWRFGDVVMRRVVDPAAAAWQARVFDALRVDGLRVSRPLRSLDGRWVVGGWCAQRFVSGAPAPRYCETMRVALILDTALSGVAAPRRWPAPDGMLVHADRMTWADLDGNAAAGTGGKAPGDTAADDDLAALGRSPAAEIWRDLAQKRRPVELPSQLIHADLFGRVLFAGSAPPAVVGVRPLWRPQGLSAAIVAVDAVAWSGASVQLFEQGVGIPCWHELVRRAALFRLALVLCHPRRTRQAVQSMVDVAWAVHRPGE